MASEVEVIKLEVDISSYAANMSKIVSATKQADTAIGALMATAKQLENDLSALGKSDVKVKVDADTSKLEGVQSSLKTLNDVSVKVDVVADTTEAETEIRALQDDVSVTVKVDADTESAKRKVDTVTSDAKDTTVKVDADTSSAEAKLDEISGQLKAIKAAAVIGVTITAANALSNLPETISNTPILGASADMSESVRTFTAKTGKEIEGIGGIIDNVFIKGFSDSRNEIAQVAATLTQVGVPAKELEAALISTFQVMSVTGYDSMEVIRAQSQLVKNDMSKDFAEAGDAIVFGFQTGGDAADDLIDTLVEYAPFFSKFGLSGANAVGIINDAMAAGAFNADKLGDTFKELDLRIDEAVTSQAGAAYDALEKLGLYDEAEAYMDGERMKFLQAAQESYFADAANFDMYEVFGTPLEDLTTAVFASLNLSDMVEADTITGTAEEASNIMRDNLGTSITELARTVESELAEAFRLAGMPLNEAIDAAKAKITEVIDLVKGGASVPEAIEIAFQIPGFSDAVNNFISGMGGIVIDLELALASLLEFIGQGDAAKGLRTDAQARAATQFEYDIITASQEDQVTLAVTRAISRGLDEAQLGKATEGAILKLIDDEELERAQMIVDELGTARVNARVSSGWGHGQNIDVGEGNALGIDPNAEAEKIAEQIKAHTQEQAGLLNLVVPFDVEVTKFEIDVDAAKTAIEAASQLTDQQALVDSILTKDVKLISDETVEATAEAQAEIQAGFTETTAIVESQTDIARAKLDAYNAHIRQMFGGETKDAIESVGEATDVTAVSFSDLNETGTANMIAFEGVVLTSASSMETAFKNLNAEISRAATGATGGIVVPTAGGGMPPMEERATGGAVAGGRPYLTGEMGAELFMPNSAGIIYTAAQTAAIMQSLQSVTRAGLGGGSTTSNVYNVSQTLNTQSNAQAYSASAAMARRIRGGL